MNSLQLFRAFGLATLTLATAHGATVDWSAKLTQPDELAVPSLSCQLVSSQGNFVFATRTNALVSLSPTLTARWIVPPAQIAGAMLTCLAHPVDGFYFALATPGETTRFERRDEAGVVLWQVPLPFIARSIHLDSVGAVYTTDKARRYAKISSAGAFIYNVTVPPGAFSGVTVNRDTNKLVLVSSDNKLYVVNDAGVAEPRFSVTPTFLAASVIQEFGLLANANSFVMAGATAANSQGPTLYELVAFSPSGVVQYRKTIGNYFFAMALDSDGTLSLISNGLNTIPPFASVWEKVGVTGDVLQSLVIPQFFVFPSYNAGSRMGHSGDVVTIESNSSRLRRISGTGVFSERLTIQGTSQFRLGYRQGSGIFLSNAPGAFVSYTDTLTDRAQTSGIGTPGSPLSIGAVSITPSGWTYLSTPEFLSPNTVFRVNPRGDKLSRILSIDGRPRALYGDILANARRGQLDFYGENLTRLFGFTTAAASSGFLPPRSQIRGSVLFSDGTYAVGVSDRIENEDGDPVQQICTVVVVSQPVSNSSLRIEPCGLVDPNFKLLGGAPEAYYVLEGGRLRARALGGQFLWETSAGRAVTSNLGADDQFAIDSSSGYFLTEGVSPRFALHKYRREDGFKNWSAGLTYPLSNLPTSIAGPFLLGGRLASVVKSGGSSFVIFNSSQTGAQESTIAIDSAFQVAFARRIPGRNEFIVGGHTGLGANSDWRISRFNQAGALLNDQVINNPSEDRAIGGEVLEDGSIIVAGQARVGADSFGLVSRVRLTPLATQTNIVSFSPTTVAFGQPVTVTAAVVAEGPEGTIRIDGRRDQFCTIASPKGSCIIEPSTAGLYRLTARYSGDRFNAPSSSRNVFFNVSGSADLAIRFEGVPRVTQENAGFSYEIVVRNISGNRTAGVTVSHVSAAGVDIVSWTCLPTTESFCGEQTSGSGSITATPLINVGDEIRYRISAIDRARSPEVYSFVATVVPPPKVTDANSSNNEATQAVSRVVFVDGFD